MWIITLIFAAIIIAAIGYILICSAHISNYNGDDIENSNT